MAGTVHFQTLNDREGLMTSIYSDLFHVNQDRPAASDHAWKLYITDYNANTRGMSSILDHNKLWQNTNKDTQQQRCILIRKRIYDPFAFFDTFIHLKPSSILYCTCWDLRWWWSAGGPHSYLCVIVAFLSTLWSRLDKHHCTLQRVMVICNLICPCVWTLVQMEQINFPIF